MPLAPGIPQCHHVRTNGVRCGSPAMRGRSLCFFHTRVSAKPLPRPTAMPSLEDGNAIQLGIANIIRRVLLCDIDYKAAYVLLHAYKLALFNLKNVRPNPYYKDVVTVDPASDPDNAGNLTEPCTYQEFEALAEELQETTEESARIESAGIESAGTEITLDACAPLLSPSSGESVGTEITVDVGAPPLSPAVGDRVGTEKMESNHAESANVRLAPTEESEGRHFLAQHASAGTTANRDSSPVGTAQRKQIQRIIVPDAIQNIINRDPNAEMTDTEFATLEAALAKLTG